MAYEPERCVRTRRHKYIRRFDDEHPTPVLANIDDGPSKDLILSDGPADHPILEERLFELLYDPNEANDLAADPAHAGVLEEMRGRLKTWIVETDDPLLEGPVPAPVRRRLTPGTSSPPTTRPRPWSSPRFSRAGLLDNPRIAK